MSFIRKARRKLGRIIAGEPLAPRKKNVPAKKKVSPRKSADSVRWENQAYLEKSEFLYILWMDRIYEKIREVPGHIVELGVAFGRNSIIFSQLMRLNGEDEVRRYFGFDTFSGYDESDLVANPQLSDVAWKENSRDRVEQRLAAAGVSHQCELIEGDIKITVKKFADENPNFRCALLYVDCNAYEPALVGLEAFLPLMMPNGIICIDEKRQGGETKAILEFARRYGFEVIRDPGPFSVPAYIQLPGISNENGVTESE